MKKKLKSYLIIIESIILTSFMLCGCKSRTNNLSVSKTDIYFDTYVTISIFGLDEQSANTILDECMNKCRYYEELLSVNIESSDISKINNRSSEVVAVSPETVQLIDKALKYSEQSEGLFDISIYSASRLWDFSKGTNQIPSPSMLKNAVTHIDYSRIIPDPINNTITLTDKEIKIDLGGIAKGYIADCICDYIKTTPASGAIINIGGDLMLYGQKGNNNYFNIGITDPFGSTAPITSANLTDKAIATSGTYVRTVTDGTNTYHHILDPKSGYSVNTDLVSATIVTDHSVDADTLCTIAILLGSDKALNYIETLPETEALLIKEDGTIIKTSSASKYFTE